MKAKIDFKTLSAWVILVLILCEVCTTAGKPTKDTQKNRHLKLQSTDKRQRYKRQAADIILMGYKAKGALGTTRPSNFFRRIGKKRAEKPALPGLPKTYLEPDIQAVAVDRTGFLLDNDDYQHLSISCENQAPSHQNNP